MDIDFGDKHYEFLLFHTDLTEDIVDHKPLILIFKRVDDNCFISEKLSFVPNTINQQERVTHLRAPFVYYIKDTNNIMINYVDRVLSEPMDVSSVGLYMLDKYHYIKEKQEDENELCYYFMNCQDIFKKRIV